MLRRILSSCVGSTFVVVTTVLAMLHRGLGGSLMFHYTFTLLSVASQMISHSPSRVTSVWRLQAEKHRSLLRYNAGCKLRTAEYSCSVFNATTSTR